MTQVQYSEYLINNVDTIDCLFFWHQCISIYIAE